MTITISKEDIELITTILDSQPDGEGLSGYIDRQTGAVEIGVAGDSDLEILPDEEAEDYDELMDEFERRYLLIPKQGSSAGYRDLEDFIEQVEDPHLQDLLDVAIQGQGAFARFKSILNRLEYDSDLQHWYKFRDQRQYDRAVEWLTNNGVEIASDKIQEVRRGASAE
jgi:Uncharacterised protein family (UPF0158)